MKRMVCELWLQYCSISNPQALLKSIGDFKNIRFIANALRKKNSGHFITIVTGIEVRVICSLNTIKHLCPLMKMCECRMCERNRLGVRA